MKNKNYLNLHLAFVSFFLIGGLLACGSTTPGDTHKTSSTNVGNQSAASGSQAGNAGSDGMASPSTPTSCPSNGAMGAADANGTIADSSGVAGSSNAADSNSVPEAADGNTLNPNSFAYAYQAQVPGTDPAPDFVFLLTTNPNACDDGNLVLKAGEPVFLSKVGAFHGVLSGGSLIYSQAQSSQGGECSITQQTDAAEVRATLTQSSRQPDGSYDYLYSLTIQGNAADLHQLSGQSAPNLLAKSCSFSTQPNATISCTNPSK